MRERVEFGHGDIATLMEDGVCLFKLTAFFVHRQNASPISSPVIAEISSGSHGNTSVFEMFEMFVG